MRKRGSDSEACRISLRKQSRRAGNVSLFTGSQSRALRLACFSGSGCLFSYRIGSVGIDQVASQDKHAL